MAKQVPIMTTNGLYKLIIPWLQKQGVAIVLLICISVGMFVYFNRTIDKMDNKINSLETSVQVLNDKLIECEKSKINMLRFNVAPTALTVDK